MTIQTELQVIAKHGLNDSCIIIHDFVVPGKDFGNNGYNLESIKEDLLKVNPDYKWFYNEEVYKSPVPGRGILYVVPELKC